MAVILVAVAWLLTYLLHSTVLLLGAFALAWLGIVRSHAGRDTLWKVALVGGIVTATAQTVLRLQPAAGHVALAARPESPLVDVASVRDVAPEVPAIPSIPRPPAATRFASSLAPPAVDAVPASVPVRTTRALFSGLHISWPAMLLNLWFVGAFAFGVRLLWMRISLARELRGRQPMVDGPLADSLAELCAGAGVPSPRLSVSDDLPGPIAFGREICLPERVLSRLTPAEQRAVLAHELGHVVRRDPAWLMATAIIQNVLFIQPLNRLARRRLRAESEYLCDDWAAERTGGVVLARCLAEVAGWVQGHAAPAAVAGMAGHCSQLVSRVERLLDGSSGIRPTRWVLRVAAGAGVLALVAGSVPGVAAEDLDAVSEVMATSDEDFDTKAVAWAPGEQGWGAVRDGGRMIVLAAGYTVRLSGHGRLGFQQYGRAFTVPDGYEIRIGGRVIDEDQDLCPQTATLFIIQTDGEGDGAWEIAPVRRSDARGYDDRTVTATASVSASASASSSPSESRFVLAHADADAETDAALNGEADAAIDTLVQLWVRDPAAVRRAARRIARTYDRELRPQFESLGVQVGRELAPQLERLTNRVGRDLAPEFARLGAALGASILSDLAAGPDHGAGSGDYRTKTKPKDHD